MIELSRDLARVFRAVLRKSVLAADPRGPSPPILCRADKGGLTLSCERGEVGLGHHTPGALPADSIVLPSTLLAEIEGRTKGTVRLESIAPSRGRANWSEGGASRVVEFATPAESIAPSPTPPSNPTRMDRSFLLALDESARTASRDFGKPAIRRVLLRGSEGSVIATDGRQLLIKRGFSLPWKDDVLIPALPVFGCRELPADGTIRLSKAGEYVTLGIGPWLLRLKGVPAGPYPDIDKVVPRLDASASRLILDPHDAQELVRALPGLPGRDEQFSPVTIDLGERVCVRARSESGPVAERILARSSARGPTVRVAMDRRYLLRATQLGFTEIVVPGPDKPLVCRDDQRTYLWMPLEDAVVPPESKGDRPSMPQPRPTPRNDPMPPTESNGAPPGDETIDPLAEAEALRSLMHEALTRTARLIGTLKRQRRQDRVVRSAMASLRRLQQP